MLGFGPLDGKGKMIDRSIAVDGNRANDSIDQMVQGDPDRNKNRNESEMMLRRRRIKPGGPMVFLPGYRTRSSPICHDPR